MGYTIRIGNAVLEGNWPKPEDEYPDEPDARWYVHGLSLEQAPYFGDSDRSNTRSPSYTGWGEFADKVGLRDFFFDKETGKMRRHPGCMNLTQDDSRYLTMLLEKYRDEHPGAEATYCECASCAPYQKHDPEKPTPHNPNGDMNLVRLTWLEWWVRWAVSNCERPAIYNS